MNKDDYKDLPLVYSCSGCSNVAQLANDIAVKLDQEKIAEMSCIVGVGGDVPAIVKIAKSGRDIIAIDGCPLSCSKACLTKHQIVPIYHFDLSKHSVKKKLHERYDLSGFNQCYAIIINILENKLKHG